MSSPLNDLGDILIQTGMSINAISFQINFKLHYHQFKFTLRTCHLICFINIICFIMIQFIDLSASKNRLSQLNLINSTKPSIFNHDIRSKMSAIKRQKPTKTALLQQMNKNANMYSVTQTDFNKEQKHKQTSRETQSGKWTEKKSKLQFLATYCDSFSNTPLSPLNRISSVIDPRLTGVLKNKAKQIYSRRFKSISQHPKNESSLQKYKNLNKQFDKQKKAILRNKRDRKFRFRSVDSRLSKIEGTKICYLTQRYHQQEDFSQNSQNIYLRRENNQKFKSARYSEIPISQFIYEDQKQGPLEVENGKLCDKKIKEIYKKSNQNGELEDNTLQSKIKCLIKLKNSNSKLIKMY